MLLLKFMASNQKYTSPYSKSTALLSRIRSVNAKRGFRKAPRIWQYRSVPGLWQVTSCAHDKSGNRALPRVSLETFGVQVFSNDLEYICGWIYVGKTTSTGDKNLNERISIIFQIYSSHGKYWRIERENIICYMYLLTFSMCSFHV